MPDFDNMTAEQKEAWKTRTRAESERMLKRERNRGKIATDPLDSADPAVRDWAQRVPKYTIDPNTGERTEHG